MITQYVDGQYGVATAVTFTLRQRAAASSDSYYSAADLTAADVSVVLDGTYDSVSDNVPSRVASATKIHTLTVSAEQMQADVVDLMIVDAAGAAFRDHHIQIRTQQNLGTLVVNAAQKGTNTTAILAQGNGTGAGLSCVGGDNDGMDIKGVLGEHTLNYGTVSEAVDGDSFKLDVSTASGSNDYYNGALILINTGTGSGQARVITDYVGSTNLVTLNKTLATQPDTSSTYIIIPGADAWSVSPGAKLSALPTFASGYGDLLQLIFERFHNAKSQNATLFTLRNGDDSGDLATAALADDSTTQTHDQLSSS